MTLYARFRPAYAETWKTSSLKEFRVSKFSLNGSSAWLETWEKAIPVTELEFGTVQWKDDYSGVDVIGELPYSEFLRLRESVLKGGSVAETNLERLTRQLEEHCNSYARHKIPDTDADFVLFDPHKGVPMRSAGWNDELTELVQAIYRAGQNEGFKELARQAYANGYQDGLSQLKRRTSKQEGNPSVPDHEHYDDGPVWR
jgi:hypothetical protein